MAIANFHHSTIRARLPSLPAYTNILVSTHPHVGVQPGQERHGTHRILVDVTSFILSDTRMSSLSNRLTTTGTYTYSNVIRSFPLDGHLKNLFESRLLTLTSSPRHLQSRSHHLPPSPKYPSPEKKSQPANPKTTTFFQKHHPISHTRIYRPRQASKTTMPASSFGICPLHSLLKPATAHK